ncbi:MAG: HipA domain-containing protein [Chloracidobacterium sp.]|nr:HipA domain-containing protein [Chloracidobacterium sp.]
MHRLSKTSSWRRRRILYLWSPHQPKASWWKRFRRMVFNILARNQDDHVKNIAFLMGKTGVWSLAPAFDMTYSYNPSGAWTSAHHMTMNGKRDGFTIADFKACAEIGSLKRGRAEKIIIEVRKAVERWPDFAARALVSDDWIKKIKNALRLELESI